MRVKALVCVLLAFPLLASGQATQTAADLMHAGLEAMGGEQKIRALTTFHFQGTVVRNMLEQSERPEGPYILENNQVEAWRAWPQPVEEHGEAPRGHDAGIWHEQCGFGGCGSSGGGEQAGPGSGEQLQEAREALALSPERVLITALASSDLHRLADLALQGVPHHEVEFTWQGSPVRIFLNAETQLPTAVEWVTAYPFDTFWSIWGDVTTRVYYSLWWLQNGCPLSHAERRLSQWIAGPDGNHHKDGFQFAVCCRRIRHRAGDPDSLRGQGEPNAGRSRPQDFRVGGNRAGRLVHAGKLEHDAGSARRTGSW